MDRWVRHLVALEVLLLYAGIVVSNREHRHFIRQLRKIRASPAGAHRRDHLREELPAGRTVSHLGSPCMCIQQPGLHTTRGVAHLLLEQDQRGLSLETVSRALARKLLAMYLGVPTGNGRSMGRWLARLLQCHGVPAQLRQDRAQIQVCRGPVDDISVPAAELQRLLKVLQGGPQLVLPSAVAGGMQNCKRSVKSLWAGRLGAGSSRTCNSRRGYCR